MREPEQTTTTEDTLTRRSWLRATAGAGAVALAAAAAPAEEPIDRKGRIRQSLVHWCYQTHWPEIEAMCRVAVQLGCRSIELGNPQDWPTLKRHGLTCAIAGSHGFKAGFNNPGEWETCTSLLRERIDQCADFGVKSVITFTGYANGIPKDEGADNCVRGLKQIVGYDHGLAWPAGATPERFAPVPRQNERAACAYFGGHIYIARFIAYDVRPGEVYPVIARRIDQHTGARLAALAPLSINLVAYFRMMRAIIYSVYSRAVERQLSRQSVVDLAEGLFRVKRESYDGLVSDNDGLHARMVEQAKGFGCPRVDD